MDVLHDIWWYCWIENQNASNNIRYKLKKVGPDTQTKYSCLSASHPRSFWRESSWGAGQQAPGSTPGRICYQHIPTPCGLTNKKSTIHIDSSLITSNLARHRMGRSHLFFAFRCCRRPGTVPWHRCECCDGWAEQGRASNILCIVASKYKVLR